VPCSSRGDTAHAPLIHVGTPSRGKTQRFMTNHAATKPTIIRIWNMEDFRSKACTPLGIG
jgi:hypothetical protein